MGSTEWHTILLVILVQAALFVCLDAWAGPKGVPAQEAKLSALFSENMVLQRGGRLPVWGWATPGGEVTVSLAGRQVSAVADKQGDWKVVMHPLSAGGPHTMTIAGEKTITLGNIMVGEVWICSGQSNMQVPIKDENFEMLNGAQEVAAANYPDIRLLDVPRTTSFAPEKSIEGPGWRICSPETAAGFSATGYFFGRELHRHLGIPVGLIHASWGGTPAESWASEGALRTMPEFGRRLDEIAKALPDVDRKYREYETALEQWKQDLDKYDAGYREGRPFWTGAKVDGDWGDMDLPCNWEDAVPALSDFDGTMWFRKDMELPATWAGKELLLRLGPINDMDRVWFNGTLVGSLEAWNQWRTPREYKIPGALVRSGKNRVCVRVFDEGGKGGICGKKEDMALLPAGGQSASALSLAGTWRYKIGADMKTMPPIPQPPEIRREGNAWLPGAPYNAMIAPLMPYGVAGVIWYQGESNAGRADQYRTLFPTLITDWRAKWGQGAFPFLFVQLANFQPANSPSLNDTWPYLREAQSIALRLPKTGMAVAIDIGEAEDIHPKNKQEVGRRLALAARHVAYGEKLVYSGPVYRSMTEKGNGIQLRFTHVGSGLATRDGATLTGFVVAGTDGQFFAADARIVRNTVVVSSKSVSKPVAVRYAWDANPTCNLTNKEGLPAAPFRTDSVLETRAPKQP